MMQPQKDPDHSSADFDHHIVLFPTRSMARTAHVAHVSSRLPAQSADHAHEGTQARVRTYVIRGVVVLAVAGRLSEVVEELDRAIQLTLAEGPRGVVCDLSGVLEGAERGAIGVLATAGKHVRDWSGIPVAVACPDPRVRALLAVDPLGGHLIVTSSVSSAVSLVLATPIPAVEWLRLEPQPTATRASREFVSCTLLGWGLGQFIPSADVVVSKLVTSSTMQAPTGIELSVAWNLRDLRLTVRDDSPDLPSQGYTQFGLEGPEQTAADGLSRAFGVLPTADGGGKVVWAVLSSARPRLLISAPGSIGTGRHSAPGESGRKIQA